MDTRRLLHDIADRSADWFDELPHRPVRADRTAAEMSVTDVLGDAPLPVEQVIEELAAEAAPGLTAMGSPRFFGFVIGGAHPAALAADWLTSTWDQNAGLAGADTGRVGVRGGRRTLARRGLNQVLVTAATDAETDAVLAAAQADGTCYPSPTTWRGRRCIRISVCNWQTTAADVDRSVAAIVAALVQVRDAALT